VEKVMPEWLRGRQAAPSTSAARGIATELARDAVAKLSELMERHPLAILDVSRLPLPKAEMKTALKLMWQIAPNEQLRNQMEVAYIHLASFQDGVGDVPLEPIVPPNSPPEKVAAILDPYILFAAQVQAETHALSQELRQFKRG
jgi:hypothetical protein